MKRTLSITATICLFTTLSYGQTWQQKADNPGPGRHHPVTFSLDGEGYMVTGSTDNSSNTKDFYKYDPANDSWTTLTDFPGEARSFAIGATGDGKAYMGFGDGITSGTLNDLWEYDPVTDTWTELASCPCAGRYHPAFAIADGRIFVGLGNNSGGNLKDWWEYNITTDSWQQLPDLPGPPRHHPYMFTVNGNVYTGLGHGTSIYKDWYKWDLTTQAWTQMNDFPAEGRVAGTQFNIGDRGFVLSGDGDNHNYMGTGEFWEYHYATDTWTSHPPHPGISRWAPGSFAIGDVVYFTAGDVSVGNNAGLQNDLWSFNTGDVAGFKEEHKNQLTVYPNPAKEVLRIKGLDGSQDTRLIIYNYNGQIVLETTAKNKTINIHGLSSGLYFLQIKGQEEQIPIKFMKK